MRQGQPDTGVVATVNGEPITAGQLVLGLLAADARFVDPESGGPPDADGLLERAIRNVLLRQEAERLSLAVAEEGVTALIELAIVAPLRDSTVPEEMKELTEELLRRRGIDQEHAADAPEVRQVPPGGLLRSRLLALWAAVGRSADEAL